MKTLLLRCFLLLSFIVVVLMAVAWWFAQRPLALSGAVDFEVERGFTMRQAARAAHTAGLPLSPDALYWIARVTGKAGRIVAGGYQVTPGMSALDLVDKLHRGDVTFAELRLIEGWNFRQVRQAVESHDWIRPDTQGMDEAALLKAVGVTEAHPEGLFFPDTYRFARYSTASSVLRMAHAAMQRHLADAWASRDPDVPL
ncbi:MAG: endolytic transglycosylase MltG, partial [Pseudazoarcus pumilus]|nr:endolytic transglycosylase MltG [Pseudazoarcus pumilus]